MRSIFITGGAGFCGSVLVPRLLNLGHEVCVYDIGYFGINHLPVHDHLTVIKDDIRNTKALAQACHGYDAFIHLAAISNDASCDLDKELTTSVNLLAFDPMVLVARASGIKRFIYLSTSSVYGISDAKDVTEDHPKVPLTLYNDFKYRCEGWLVMRATDEFVCTILRPATVCGYSPRQRLDLSVNILTNHAVNTGKITVFGGKQMRPNLHIEDYCAAIEAVLDAPAEKIAGQVFNVGNENMSIEELAWRVKAMIPVSDVEVSPSDDQRSYRINSDKIADVLGFRPKRFVDNAVQDLFEAFQLGKIPNPMTDDIYYNVKRMKNLGAK